MKKVIGICVLLSLLSMAVQVQAVPRYWKSIGLAGQDGLWGTGANWADDMTTAPLTGDVAYILNRVGDWESIPCNFASTTISLQALRVGDATVGGHDGIAVMNMSSGTITTTEAEVMIGVGSTAKGVLNMSGGTITSNNWFVVGQNGGDGDVNMTGGTINCAVLAVANLAHSKGRIHLNGGTINVTGAISIEGQNDYQNGSCTSADGVIDITGSGKIVICKNEPDLAGWFANMLSSAGLLTSYSGAGTLMSTADPVTGWVTIEAVAPVLSTNQFLWSSTTDQLWTTGNNWLQWATVPVYTSDVYIINGTGPFGDFSTVPCLFKPGMVADVKSLNVQGLGYTGVADFNMTGGEFVASGLSHVGKGAGGRGVMQVHGGDITLQDYFIVGQNGGDGTLTMTGGTLSTNGFWVANGLGSKGHVHFDGGTVRAFQSLKVAQGAVLDFSGGILQITPQDSFDPRPWAQDWVDNGLATAYDGAGEVRAVRDDSNNTTTFYGYLAPKKFWWNRGSNNLWTTPANWGEALNSAPIDGDAVYILNGAAPVGNTNACSFTAGMTAAPSKIVVQDLGYTGNASLAISGGTLTTQSMVVGGGGVGTGTVLISGGTVNVTGCMIGRDANSNGTLRILTGSSLTAESFSTTGVSGSSTGRTYLDGGTLYITGTLNGNDGGVIDILAGGKIVIAKNQPDLIWFSAYLDKNGWVKAYGGNGYLITSCDPVTGYTTISSTLLAGDFNGDGVVNKNDLGMFAANWLAGGMFGTAPGEEDWNYTMYDVTRDGRMDFQDFALMAQNW